MMREFQIRLTEPQYEVLKTIAELSGDSIDEYLQTVVIQGLQSDIELYLGNSKNVTEIMYKKLGFRPFGKEEEEEKEEVIVK
jgi:hypothetical protein